MHKMDMTIGLL